MDELIARLDEMLLGDSLRYYQEVGVDDELREAATALRSAQEREREYREALEFYSCACKTGQCEHGTPDDGQGFVSCGFRARAVLEKHKGVG